MHACRVKKRAADEQLVPSACKSPRMCTSTQQIYDCPGSVIQLSPESDVLDGYSPILVRNTLDVNIYIYMYLLHIK